ncbi:MAG: AMP-binding protein, partial [Burkholderiales bacterium]
MKRIWLEFYPPGVPYEVDAQAYASLNDLFEKCCERFSDHVAFTCLGGTLSYADVERLSRQFAASLEQGLSLTRGERVAIMLPNVLQYPIALFGALRAGLIVVNVNPLYTADELAQQLADAQAKAIIVLENFAHTVERVLGQTALRHVIVTSIGDLLPFPRRWLVDSVVTYVKRAVPRWNIPDALQFRDVLAAGRARMLRRIAIDADDIAFLQYTGGTTGRAKGAVLTHGNVIANVEQVTAWVSPSLKPGEETVITALPLYHVFALTANLLVFVRLGGRNVLIPNARDLNRLVRTLGKTRFTCITGVNTLFKAMLEAPGFGKVSARSRGVLKAAVSGGMSVEREVAERWQQAMGVPLVEGYGLTEASPVVCANRLDVTAFTGKLGLPLPSTEIRIASDDGAELPIGEIGEICVRGPQVMRGYWNAPLETAQAFTADGWLRTGDIGRMDMQGYVEFLERKKDVIVVSGFKAYPSEIEAVVMQLPGVKDAAAVGTHDDHTGEAVALFVVRKDPSLTASAIRAHCSRHLTGYKRPKTVEFREQLPKSVIGKTLR